MEAPGSTRLTNDDFRKLLMTPRQAPDTPVLPSTYTTPTVATTHTKLDLGSTRTVVPKTPKSHETKKKKKSVYSALKREEDLRLAELAEKYRDRAKERREHSDTSSDFRDPMNITAYKAVAPDLKTNLDTAERRKRLIQESKYLGGDMEHTHLVKGLDYALLQKIRSEADQMEREKRVEDENEIEDKEQIIKEISTTKFRTIMGKNIHHIVVSMGSKKIERNELFIPGRMAYVIDLEEESETDIPTTLVRSKLDVPSTEISQTVSTNDIVISKLTEILTYLRHSSKKNKKLTKKAQVPEDNRSKLDEKRSIKKTDPFSDSIYGDIGDYKPSSTKSSSHSKSSSSQRVKKSSSSTKATTTYFRESAAEKEAKEAETKREKALKIARLVQEPDSYVECYPGFEEMNDAIDDSDEEVDFTKMDLGARKCQIGRWDFDTAEEYSDYMDSVEALPKAAFQYGVKMSDGRWSRKGQKHGRNEFDKEWERIQTIIHSSSNKRIKHDNNVD